MRTSVVDVDIITGANLSRSFRRGGSIVQAVVNVDLTVERGRCLGIIGESGSGKSTLARMLVGLLRPSAGEIRYRGEDLWAKGGRRKDRQKLQIVFQDPISSLNPRRRVGRIVREGLDIHHIGSIVERRHRVKEMLEHVGLDEEIESRYPHELSGGQCQRVSIARALAVSPDVLVADEATSSLDVSVQARIVKLLMGLKTNFGLTLCITTHNLAVAGIMADWLLVMYGGQVVESGPAEKILHNPIHPYTVALLSAVPESRGLGWGNNRVRLKSIEVSSSDTGGCRFMFRCPIATAVCETTPSLREFGTSGQSAACFFAGELKLEIGSNAGTFDLSESGSSTLTSAETIVSEGSLRETL